VTDAVYAEVQKEGKMLHLRKYTQAFDPEAIIILDGALDGAWQLLKGRAQLNGNAKAARTALAKHIFDVAATGERDRQRLIEGASARFGA
jgi:hypothetical protein